jgi:hypothetical protein
MARQKVDAPSARIQRNLLSPVDTFYQSKTGVVVQPGDKSDGLRSLEKALNVAKRDNDVREEKWNKEQEALARKQATIDIANNPNEWKLAKTAHPSKSAAWSIGYNATVGEAHAADYASKLNIEYEKNRNGSYDTNGKLVPFDASRWLSQKLGAYNANLPDDPHYIGAASNRLSQYSNTLYAQHAAYTNKAMRDDLAVKTGQLIAGDFTSPSLSDEDKASGSYVRIQKAIALGMDPKEARTLWLKQAINSDDIGLISQLQKMSETGALRRLDGSKETLTAVEYGSLEDAKDRIIQRERRDQNAAEVERGRLAKAADSQMRNIVTDDGLPTTEKEAIAYVRQKLGDGSEHVDDQKILSAIGTIRTLRQNTQNARGFQTDAQKTANFVKAIDTLRNTDKTKMEEVAGQLALQYGMTTSGHNSLLSAAVRMGKEGSMLGSGNLDSLSKLFGKSIANQVDGDGILIKNDTISFINDVEVAGGRFRDPVSDKEKTVDLNTTQGKATLRAAAQKYALIQYANSENGKQLLLGPDNVTNRSRWNADFQGTSLAAKYKILAQEGIPGFSLDTLQPKPAPDPNVRPPDATANVGAAAAAKVRRKQGEFDRRIRPNQITADSVTLDSYQIQAAAEALRKIVPTPITPRMATTVYQGNETYIAEAQAKQLRKDQEEAIKKFFNLDYGLRTDTKERKQLDAVVKAVLDYISQGVE